MFRPLDNGLIVFSGGSSSVAGIYTNDTGGADLLNLIADRDTPAPGGGTFLSFTRRPSVDEGAVAFWASTSLRQGIFTNVGGSLRVAADTTTAVPDAPHTFRGFDREPSLDGVAVAFKGNAPGGHTGIYVEQGGVLTKVINLNDILDGKPLDDVHLGREGFSHGAIVFQADFADVDGSKGIYVARLAGSVHETHIDFDFDANGNPIPHLERIDDEYAAIGVHFTGEYWTGQTSIAFPTYSVRPSPNYLCTFGGTAGGGNPDCERNNQVPPDVPLAVDLDFPAVFASIEAYTRNDGVFDSDGLFIEAFDGGGNSLGIGGARCNNDPFPHLTEGICVAAVEAPGIRRLVITREDFPDALDSLWITPAAEEEEREGDFNGDGCVDRADFGILMIAIRGPEPRDPVFDLNGDGVVNRADARTQIGLFDNPRGAACE